MIIALKYKKIPKKSLIVALFFLIFLVFPFSVASAATTCVPDSNTYCCGDPGSTSIQTSIDLGCKSQGTPIADLSLAIIRFLSAGVGVVIVASTVFAGIMYTTSRDNPESSKKAKQRLVGNVIALLVFIFSYAILNFLIPGGFLQ